VLFIPSKTGSANVIRAGDYWNDPYLLALEFECNEHFIVLLSVLEVVAFEGPGQANSGGFIQPHLSAQIEGNVATVWLGGIFEGDAVAVSRSAIDECALFSLGVYAPSKGLQSTTPETCGVPHLNSVELCIFGGSEAPLSRLRVGLPAQDSVFCSQSIVSVALKLEIVPIAPGDDDFFFGLLTVEHRLTCESGFENVWTEAGNVAKGRTLGGPEQFVRFGGRGATGAGSPKKA